jgi:hypothetical protein
MSTIVTRSGKGSPLTNTEVDANFTNLNTDKYQQGDSAILDDLRIVDGTPRVTLEDSDGTNQKLELAQVGGNTIFTLRDGDSFGSLDFKASDGSVTRSRFKVATDGDFNFYNSVGTTKMKWDAPNARLGINTNSPSRELDVIGKAYIADGVYIGGNVSANLLDEYEEGTWTAGISNSAGSQTSSTTVSGFYTKIGRLVHVSVAITGINNDAFSGGSLRITGLPFTIKSSTHARGHGDLQVNNFDDANAPDYFLQGVQNTQTAQIKYNKNNDVAASIDVNRLNDSDTSAIIMDLTYIT